MIGSIRGVIVGAALASSVGFASGWLVNGWRLNAQIERQAAQDAAQEARELIEALDDLKEQTALSERLSAELAQARSETRTEIRYIEREVPSVVQDNPTCALIPAAVGLLDAAASGDRAARARSPRRRPSSEVPGDAGDGDNPD